ncbi:MAG: hypothetical protein Q4B43_10175 [Bacteroidota bacterium]|nr:hypothetical protein [Bacteroidota bacterium]
MTRDGDDGFSYTVYDGVTGEVITRRRANSIGYYDNSSGNY